LNGAGIHPLAGPPTEFHAGRVSSFASTAVRCACSLVVALLPTLPVNAQLAVDLDALNAPVGGSTLDRFGAAVEWQSSYILVGAPSWTSISPTLGPQTASGAVHVYFPIGGGVYTYAGTATEPEPQPNNFYGQALSATDGWVAVGAPGTNLPGGCPSGTCLQAGAAWIWRKSGNVLANVGKVTHGDPRAIDLFGSAVSLWNDRESGRPPELAVGAPLDDAPSTNCGSVTIFALSSLTGEFEKTAFIAAPVLPGASSFSASDGLFGCTVVHDGDLLIVGAKRRTESVDKQGLVFVFRRNIDESAEPIMPSPTAWGPWKLMQVLRTATTPLVSEEFGTSLDLYGNLLAVGAPGGSTSPGSVTVFSVVDQLGSSFIPTGRMEAVGGRDGDQFGASVQVTSSICYVGAPGYDAGSGATLVPDRGVVYEFKWNPSAFFWEQTFVLHPLLPAQSVDPTVSMGVAGAGMGTSLALGVGEIVVGAPKANNAFPSQGLVMVYESERGTCYGDINGDGAVNSPDLALLFATWGSSEQFADLDNDGLVSGLDLVVLLASYGPCGL